MIDLTSSLSKHEAVVYEAWGKPARAHATVFGIRFFAAEKVEAGAWTSNEARTDPAKIACSRKLAPNSPQSVGAACQLSPMVREEFHVRCTGAGMPTARFGATRGADCGPSAGLVRVPNGRS
jgi:hypothetical protein